MANATRKSRAAKRLIELNIQPNGATVEMVHNFRKYEFNYIFSEDYCNGSSRITSGLGLMMIVVVLLLL